MIIKHVAASVSVIVIAGFAVACTPEKMTTSQACRAWLDMERNSPKTSEMETAKYTVDYYRDFSTRTDGVLGESFAGMVRAEQATIDASDGKLPDSEFDRFYASYSALIRVCGNPLNQKH